MSTLQIISEAWSFRNNFELAAMVQKPELITTLSDFLILTTKTFS